MKKLLITTVTHGDEGFAIPVVTQLRRQFSFAWRKNNIPAYKLKKRFFEQDLNRSAPGNPKSPIYEERLAYKLVQQYSKYQTVIDIHGSVSYCGIFALLSEPSTQNIELAKKLDIANIVLWPSMRANSAPLTQFIPNSLEIECGPKNDPTTSQQLSEVLQKFLSNKTPTQIQTFYIVTGLLSGNIKVPMQDFQETSYAQTTFTPLLVNQYPGIKCYMMQKLGTTLAV